MKKQYIKPANTICDLGDGNVIAVSLIYIESGGSNEGGGPSSAETKEYSLRTNEDFWMDW